MISIKNPIAAALLAILLCAPALAQGVRVPTFDDLDELRSRIEAIEQKLDKPTDPVNPGPVDPDPHDPHEPHEPEDPDPPIIPDPEPIDDIPGSVTHHTGESVLVPNYGDVEAVDDLTIDGPYERENLIVRGKLHLTTGCQLRCRNLFGLPGSVILIDGDAQITFMDLPLHVPDTAKWGNGFVTFGHLQVAGDPKTEYIRLATEPQQGDTVLTLAATPENWKVGDRLILPDTRGGIHPSRRPAGATEWHEIAAIDGPVVTLAKPVAASRRGGRNEKGELVYLPHLVNLTRSVVFRSENPEGVRGHVAFVGSAKVDVRYASFQDLGRTTNANISGANPAGRYAIHHHHVMQPFATIGNVVEDTFHAKWGITIHGSSYGTLSKNIVVNTSGACIVTEDGNEIENRIEGNLTIQSSGAAGSTDQAKDGRRRDGVWLRGPQNYVNGNIYYGQGGGVVYFSQAAKQGPKLVEWKIPTGPGKHPTQLVDIRTMPILSSRGNESWGAIHSWECWDLQIFGPANQVAVIRENVAINGDNEHGGINVYSGKNLHFIDCVFYGETMHVAVHPLWKDSYKLARGPVFDLRAGVERSTKVTGTKVVAYLNQSYVDWQQGEWQ